MAQGQRYQITYAEQVFAHMASIDTKYHSIIRETILEQLQFTPYVVTRNRKALTPPAPFLSNWEIRFGTQNMFRVVYDINESEQCVEILGIGIKIGNRLYFGKEELTQ